MATLFSLSIIHLSNWGLACEESEKQSNNRQAPTTDNHQHSTTRKPQQPWTATSDTLQQTRTDTLDNQNEHLTTGSK